MDKFFSRKNKKPNTRLGVYEQKFPNIPREKLAALEESIRSDYERKLETLTICLNDLSNDNEKLKRENQAILKILKSKEDMLIKTNMKLLESEVRSSEYLKMLEEESFQLEMCIKENEKLSQDILLRQSQSTKTTSQDNYLKTEANDQKSDAGEENINKEISSSKDEKPKDLNESDDTSESYESHGDHELNEEYEELLLKYKDYQKSALFNLIKKLKVTVDNQRKELFDRSDEMDTSMRIIEKNEKKYTKVVDYYKKTLRNEKSEREEAEKKSLELKKKVITLEYILEGVDSESDNSSNSDYESEEEEKETTS